MGSTSYDVSDFIKIIIMAMCIILIIGCLFCIVVDSINMPNQAKCFYDIERANAYSNIYDAKPFTIKPTIITYYCFKEKAVN
jgi:hypothetical protein